MFVTQNKPTALKYLGAIEPLLNHELYFESNNVGVLAELATNSVRLKKVYYYFKFSLGCDAIGSVSEYSTISFSTKRLYLDLLRE